MLALLALNPNRQAHQLKLKHRFTELNPIASKFIGKAYRNTLKFHSYYIISYLTDGEIPITIGVLGFVWVNDAQIDIQ